MKPLPLTRENLEKERNFCKAIHGYICQQIDDIYEAGSVKKYANARTWESFTPEFDGCEGTEIYGKTGTPTMCFHGLVDRHKRVVSAFTPSKIRKRFAEVAEKHADASAFIARYNNVHGTTYGNFALPDWESLFAK